jgi:hypothetical protein
MFIKWMFQYSLVKSQHIKGTEGIKDISNICSRFVVVKHIIYKHNINFPYFIYKFSYLLTVFSMDYFI